MKTLFPILFAPALLAQMWIPQDSGVAVSLRGLSAVNPTIAWASGAAGTWLRTVDAGRTWQSGRVDGAADLDFRGIRAFDDRTAVLLSAGPGDKSRIYKTNDAGAHWILLFTNPDPKGFFDAIAFWDARRGIVLGDAVDGHMGVFTTADAGRHWERRQTPTALPNEGAFAASNSCLTVLGDNQAWFGTGGKSAARIFHSKDGGKTWTVATAPIRNDSASAGVFSIAFRDAMHGIAVGGDYAKDKDARQNIAVSNDGGLSWTAPKGTPPHGFRSAVAYIPTLKLWVAAGTSGSDTSLDDGETWKPFDDSSFNAIGGLWAAGANGRI